MVIQIIISIIFLGGVGGRQKDCYGISQSSEC